MSIELILQCFLIPWMAYNTILLHNIDKRLTVVETQFQAVSEKVEELE